MSMSNPQADTDEYVYLSESQTWHQIYMTDMPQGRKSTYLNPQYKEKIDHKGEHEHRSRFTAGGDRLDYPGAVSARIADIKVVKVLLNSALSDDAELMTFFTTSSSTSSPPFLVLSADELDSVDKKSPLIQEESVIRRRNNVARKVGVGLDRER
jgi:hypothetical protein